MKETTRMRMETESDGTAGEASKLFSSFVMGGFECSTHRIAGGRRLDLLASTRHDALARADYERLGELGITAARDGIRWHLIEARPGRYDFSSAIDMVRAARDTGTQVVWDLLHYGWPDHLDIMSPAFVEHFAGLARAFTELLVREAKSRTNGRVDSRPPILCPVNEISFFAWAGGSEGYFNPFFTDRAGELKDQLVRAAIRATAAILEVAPSARIVHTDPVINVVPGDPGDRSAAERQRLSQFEAFDMIAGRARPELGGSPRYLDILGLNYYVHNQWIYPGGFGSLIVPSHPLYRPPSELFRDMYLRHRRPLFLAETGIEDDARPAWLRYVGGEVRRARGLGVPIEGLCLYPIVSHPGWVDDRHCHNGLWDYADAAGHRDTYPPLEAEVRAQAARFAEPLPTSPCVGDDAAHRVPGGDAAALDEAAHWMEITSTRGFAREDT